MPAVKKKIKKAHRGNTRYPYCTRNHVTDARTLLCDYGNDCVHQNKEQLENKSRRALYTLGTKLLQLACLQIHSYKL